MKNLRVEKDVTCLKLPHLLTQIQNSRPAYDYYMTLSQKKVSIRKENFSFLSVGPCLDARQGPAD